MRETLHRLIADTEFPDPGYADFCSKISASIQSGEILVKMGPWRSINAEAAEAITTCGRDVTLEVSSGGVSYRIVIPAGADLHDFADHNGCVCVICLAEAFGYRLSPNLY